MIKDAKKKFVHINELIANHLRLLEEYKTLRKLNRVKQEEVDFLRSHIAKLMEYRTHLQNYF